MCFLAGVDQIIFFSIFTLRCIVKHLMSNRTGNGEFVSGLDHQCSQSGSRMKLTVFFFNSNSKIEPCNAYNKPTLKLVAIATVPSFTDSSLAGKKGHICVLALRVRTIFARLN